MGGTPRALERMMGERQYVIAVEVFRSIIGNDPPSPGQKTDKEYAQLALVAERLNRDGKHIELVTLFQEYTRIGEIANSSFWNEHGVALGKLGVQANDLDIWNLAYASHGMALALDRNDPVYLYNLAVAASWVGELEEALALFNQYAQSGHVERLQDAVQAAQRLQEVLKQNGAQKT